MNKRGSWKYLLVFFVAVFLIVGVTAEKENVSRKISSLSNDTQKYIKNFVDKEKISEDKINSIEQVDLQNPPEEVKLGDKIEDTNVAIYQVNYTKENESKNLFVVTYSSEEFKVPLELKPATAMEYLSFGETAETSSSIYLKTNTGVRSSADKGYVMMDEGSITGISTNIEAVSGEGRINIIVYINGEDVGLRNLIYVDAVGIKKDYDKQSKGVIKFLPGDVISVYAETQGGIVWKDAINLVKIELD